MKEGCKRIYYIYTVLFACISIYLFFYKQIDNGFSLIFGEKYDAAIESVIVSHWFQWLIGNQSWDSPLYFFPYKDILGYNDGYLIYGLVASVFRFMGVNSYVAQEFMHIVIKLIGFFSMLGFINHLAKDKSFIAILAASLYTLIINSSNQGVHGQLFLMSFCPFLAILLVKFVDAVNERNGNSALLFGCSFSLFYVCALLTSFYSAWFFLLFSVIFVFAFIFINNEKFICFIKALWELNKIVLFVVVFLFACSIPFLIVYLPKLAETGGQNYAVQLSYSLNPLDVINFGTGSLIWGALFKYFNNQYPLFFRPGEFAVGFTPDVFAFLLFVLSYFLMKWRTYRKDVILVLCIAILISLIIPISIHDKSIWYFVNKIIPGAKGMRVIARYYLFLSFPIVLLLVMFSLRWMKYHPSKVYFGHFIFVFLIASQVSSTPPVHFDVKQATTLINSVSPPPIACQSFFVLNKGFDIQSHGIHDYYYDDNVKAMLISDHINLPTVNGFSTFNPPDWHFEHKPGYLSHIYDYIEHHQLNNVCMYDIQDNKWFSKEDINFFADIKHLLIGKELYFNDKGDWSSYLYSGWSEPESWGVWSNAKLFSILLPMSNTDNNHIKYFSFKSKGFLTPIHNKINVKIYMNGQYVGSYLYKYPDDLHEVVRNILIPSSVFKVKKNTLDVMFEVDNPVSPASLGNGGDERLLGLGVNWVKLEI